MRLFRRVAGASSPSFAGSNVLGLSTSMFSFLFLTHRSYIFKDNGATSKNAIELGQKEAIARLRKFIYYVLHKREIMVDYDSARKMGDIGIAQKISQEMSLV